MTRVTYHGHETMAYLHYIDLSSGKTLVCEPGNSYDVVPAGGNNLSAGTEMPLDGKFTKVEKSSDKEKSDNGHEATKGTMPSRIKE